MEFYDFSLNDNVCFLKNVFKNISNSGLDNIITKSYTKKYQKGELILSKDNCTDALYILIDGIIQIGYLSPLGRFHAFNYYSEQNVINLLPCLNQQKIDYDYYAFNQVRVLVVPRHIIQNELNNNNILYQDVLQILSQRMYALLHEIKFSQVANLHQKVCHVLWKLVQQYGVSHPDGLEIKLKISQHDLADLLSSSRQTINKEIKKLVNLNVVFWQYENIIIHDLKYIESRIYEV